MDITSDAAVGSKNFDWQLVTSGIVSAAAVKKKTDNGCITTMFLSVL